MNRPEIVRNFVSDLNRAAVGLLTGKTKPVDAVQKIARLEICKQCEHFNAHLYQCRHCKCFLKLKAAVNVWKCPLDKWNEIDEQNNQ